MRAFMAAFIIEPQTAASPGGVAIPVLQIVLILWGWGQGSRLEDRTCQSNLEWQEAD